jgi:hypothetical protein
MTRQAPCGPPEASRRSRLARTYLDVAEGAAAQGGEEARNVAAGNAVLAAIAAADASAACGWAARAGAKPTATPPPSCGPCNPREPSEGVEPRRCRTRARAAVSSPMDQ